MLLIFLWYLLTTPSDHITCTLWVKEPPTAEALIAACGFSDLGKYRLDLVPLDGTKAICSRPGDSLLSIDSECALPASLDHYYIRIIQPNYSTVVCPLTLDTDRQPVDADVLAQCPAYINDWKEGKLIAKYLGSQPKPETKKPICASPSITIGPGLYLQASSTGDLYTDDQLTWLAGRLIWFGLVHPFCDDGGSGLDPVTLAANGCGQIAAHDQVIIWQNRFNDDIYSAAQTYHVPAKLLKRILMTESQLWPLWTGADGESGVMQLTENGADVFLRYDPDYDKAYPGDRVDTQYWKRLAFRNNLSCFYCSLDQGMNQMKTIIPLFARLLAAYRCRAVEITPGLNGEAAWRQAAIDYNGSEEYLRRIER